MSQVQLQVVMETMIMIMMIFADLQIQGFPDTRDPVAEKWVPFAQIRQVLASSIQSHIIKHRHTSDRTLDIRTTQKMYFLVLSNTLLLTSGWELLGINLTDGGCFHDEKVF